MASLGVVGLTRLVIFTADNQQVVFAIRDIAPIVARHGLQTNIVVEFLSIPRKRISHSTAWQACLADHVRHVGCLFRVDCHQIIDGCIRRDDNRFGRDYVLADLHFARCAAFDAVGMAIREDLPPLFTDRFGYGCEILEWVDVRDLEAYCRTRIE